MKNTTFTGLFLAFLFASSMLIAGCSGGFAGAFGGDRRAKCAEGDSCVYYSGSRGIMMFIENPPRMFYYHSSDLGQIDGNTFDVNVRLRNDGASDSYGAVFITGFNSDMFQITRVDEQGETPIVISPTRSSCAFDLMSLGQTIGQWNFAVQCLGGSYRQYGDLKRISLGPEFFKNIASQFGWSDLPIENLHMTWNDDGVLQFGVGAEYGVMNFGRSLMMMVSAFNFEALGGSSFTMKGDNAEYPGGDIDFKTFKVQMISRWPAGQDYYNLPYQLKTCFAYTTFVSPTLCIDPDPFSQEEKICYAETYTWGGSQGAPVAVTRVQQTNTGKELILEMTIRNVGGGTVWDVGYLEGCSPYYPGKPKEYMQNVVYLGYAYVGDRVLDCSDYYKVRLDPNTQEARITCRYSMTQADDIGSGYTMPLKMELWYGYEETLNQQITIRRID